MPDYCACHKSDCLACRDAHQTWGASLFWGHGCWNKGKVPQSWRSRWGSPQRFCHTRLAACHAIINRGDTSIPMRCPARQCTYESPMYHTITCANPLTLPIHSHTAFCLQSTGAMSLHQKVEFHILQPHCMHNLDAYITFFWTAGCGHAAQQQATSNVLFQACLILIYAYQYCCHQHDVLAFPDGRSLSRAHHMCLCTPQKIGRRPSCPWLPTLHVEL